MNAAYDSTAVIIPALNAEATLPSLMERLRAHFVPEQIIVVDDGSSDRTKEAAERLHTIALRHPLNLGKGAALETGFRFCRGQAQFNFVLTMDADLQHAPEDIPALFEAQQRTAADIVVGTRKRFGVGMPVARIISNTITSALVSMRSKTKIEDSQCGFRLIRSAVIQRVFLEARGYEAETEFLIKAAQNGFGIASAPIQTIYRNEKSHMTHAATTKLFLKTLLRDY